VPKSPEWIELKQKIHDLRVTSLYHIGTVYRIPVIDLVSNKIKNYPLLAWYGWSTGCGVMTMPQQWYLEIEKK